MGIRKILARFLQAKRRRNRNRNTAFEARSRYGFELLEEKRLLAITWANQFFTSGPDNPNFGVYGPNEPIARQIVNHAIDDWNAVITNFNYAEDSDTNPTNNLNDTFNLTLVATSLGQGVRGDAEITSFNVDDAPTAGRVRIDDNGAGAGWFFDTTPTDDVEFTGREKGARNRFLPADVPINYRAGKRFLTS